VNAAVKKVAPAAAEIPLAQILSFVGEGARVLVGRSLRHSGLALSADEVLPVYIECYAERLLDTTLLYPGVAEALDTLTGATLAVLTNKPGDFSRRILEALGVAGRFACVLGAGDVPSRKPDPAGLLRLMADARAAREETWMIGDSATDVAVARAAGVRAAGVTWGFHPAALRAARPDRLIARPLELATLLAS
jgi:phosphoglycolate phosphatase